MSKRTILILGIMLMLFATVAFAGDGGSGGIQNKLIEWGIVFILGIVFSKWFLPMFAKHPKILKTVQDVTQIAHEIASDLVVMFPKANWDDLLLFGIVEFQKRLPKEKISHTKATSIMRSAIIDHRLLPNPPEAKVSTP